MQFDIPKKLRERYVQNKDLYPNRVKTSLAGANIFSLTYTNLDRDYGTLIKNLTLHGYFKIFKTNRGRFNLHEQLFQKKVVEWVETDVIDDIESYAVKDFAHIFLFRTFKLASFMSYENNWQIRDELGRSFIYNWIDQKMAIKHREKKAETPKYEIINASTIDVIRQVWEETGPTKRICWLSCANAHSCGGIYSKGIGSQEENTMTASSAMAIICANAERVNNYNILKQWWFSGLYEEIVFKPGFHIPPGGNYFAPSRFSICGEKISCYMIAAAFADFRWNAPWFKFGTEYSDYYNLFGPPHNKEELEKRLMMDIMGILMTAVEQQIDVLILAAGGCGAFNHDPLLEAILWKRALDKYAIYFERIVFGIKGGTTTVFEAVLTKN